MTAGRFSLGAACPASWALPGAGAGHGPPDVVACRGSWLGIRDPGAVDRWVEHAFFEPRVAVVEDSVGGRAVVGVGVVPQLAEGLADALPGLAAEGRGKLVRGVAT